jgi:hypothetical protein
MFFSHNLLKVNQLQMKNFTLLLTVLTISSLNLLSCKNSGCTDKTAINFDSDAKRDDGSCAYYADIYIGSWTASDTTYTTPKGGSTTKVVKNYSFVAQKKNGTTVYLNGFGSCKDTLWGQAAEDRFNVSNGSLCTMTSVLFLKDNKTLTYTYLPTNAPIDMKIEVRGRASR